jgi:hypothetical protein
MGGLHLNRVGCLVLSRWWGVPDWALMEINLIGCWFLADGSSGAASGDRVCDFGG